MNKLTSLFSTLAEIAAILLCVAFVGYSIAQWAAVAVTVVMP